MCVGASEASSKCFLGWLSASSGAIGSGTLAPFCSEYASPITSPSSNPKRRSFPSRRIPNRRELKCRNLSRPRLQHLPCKGERRRRDGGDNYRRRGPVAVWIKDRENVVIKFTLTISIRY